MQSRCFVFPSEVRRTWDRRRRTATWRGLYVHEACPCWIATYGSRQAAAPSDVPHMSTIDWTADMTALVASEGVDAKVGGGTSPADRSAGEVERSSES